MFKMFKEDIAMVFERDPAAGNRWDVLFLYPNLHAVWSYRIAHLLWQKGFRFLPKLISFLTHLITGIEIHPGARSNRFWRVWRRGSRAWKPTSCRTQPLISR